MTNRVRMPMPINWLVLLFCMLFKGKAGSPLRSRPVVVEGNDLEVQPKVKWPDTNEAVRPVMLEAQFSGLDFPEEFVRGDLMFEAAFNDEAGRRIFRKLLQQGHEVFLGKPVVCAFLGDLANGPLNPQPHR